MPKRKARRRKAVTVAMLRLLRAAARAPDYTLRVPARGRARQDVSALADLGLATTWFELSDGVFFSGWFCATDAGLELLAAGDPPPPR